MYPAVKPGDRIRYEDYAGTQYYGDVLSFINNEGKHLPSEENDPCYGSGDAPEYHYIHIRFDDGAVGAIDYIFCEVLTFIDADTLFAEREGRFRS